MLVGKKIGLDFCCVTNVYFNTIEALGVPGRYDHDFDLVHLTITLKSFFDTLRRGCNGRYQNNEIARST